MKKTLFFLISLVGLSGVCYYFQTEIADKYYEIRYPPIKEYCVTDDKSGEWMPIQDSTKATRYRIVSYDNNGIPVGLIKSYLIDGVLVWKGHAVTLNPFLPQGNCAYYYPNGQVQSEGYYVQGEMNGIHSRYFENSQLKFTGNYTNGLADGLFKSFDEDGTPKMQQLFISDTLHFSDYNAEDFIKKLELDEVKKVGAFFKAAQKHWNEDKFDLAVENLNNAISLHPNYLAAYELRGRCYTIQKKYNESIADFEHLLQTEYPLKYIANYKISANLKYQDRKDDAIQRYLHTTTICPSTEAGLEVKSECFSEIAYIYSDMKQYSKGIEYTTKAIEISPTSNNFLSRAVICIVSEIDSLQSYALADCNKSISIDNQNADAYSYRALLKAKSNDLQGALSDARTALNIEPSHQIASNIHSQVYAALYPPQNHYYSDYPREPYTFWDGLSDAYSAYAAADFLNDVGKGDYFDALGGLFIDGFIQNAINDQK